MVTAAALIPPEDPHSRPPPRRICSISSATGSKRATTSASASARRVSSCSAQVQVSSTTPRPGSADARAADVAEAHAGPPRAQAKGRRSGRRPSAVGLWTKRAGARRSTARGHAARASSTRRRRRPLWRVLVSLSHPERRPDGRSRARRQFGSRQRSRDPRRRRRGTRRRGRRRAGHRRAVSGLVQAEPTGTRDRRQVGGCRGADGATRRDGDDPADARGAHRRRHRVPRGLHP